MERATGIEPALERVRLLRRSANINICCELQPLRRAPVYARYCVFL